MPLQELCYPLEVLRAEFVRCLSDEELFCYGEGGEERELDGEEGEGRGG